MNRLLVALAVVGVLASLPTAPAVAQQSGFGVKGGANYSDLRGDLPVGPGPRGFDPRVGWAAGAFLSLEVSHNVFLKPEAYYVRRSAEQDGGPLGPTTVLTADYIEVPLLLELRAGDPYSRVRPILFFGPTAAYLLEADLETEGTGTRVDVTDDLAEIDFGVIAGAGLVFPGGLELDARYTYGITDVFDDAPEPTDLKWGIVSVMLGYRF